MCETAAAGTELALGMARDPALGPLVVISAGGVLIEIFSERAVVLPPVTRSQAAGDPATACASPPCWPAPAASPPPT